MYTALEIQGMISKSKQKSQNRSNTLPDQTNDDSPRAQGAYEDKRRYRKHLQMTSSRVLQADPATLIPYNANIAYQTNATPGFSNSNFFSMSFQWGFETNDVQREKKVNNSNYRTD